MARSPRLSSFLLIVGQPNSAMGKITANCKKRAGGITGIKTCKSRFQWIIILRAYNQYKGTDVLLDGYWHTAVAHAHKFEELD